MNLEALKPIVAEFDAALLEVEICERRCTDIASRRVELQKSRDALAARILANDEARVQQLMSIDERAEAIGASTKDKAKLAAIDEELSIVARAEEQAAKAMDTATRNLEGSGGSGGVRLRMYAAVAKELGAEWDKAIDDFTQRVLRPLHMARLVTRDRTFRAPGWREQGLTIEKEASGGVTIALGHRITSAARPDYNEAVAWMDVLVATVRGANVPANDAEQVTAPN